MMNRFIGLLLVLIFWGKSQSYSVFPQRPYPFLFVHEFPSDLNFLSKDFKKDLSDYLMSLAQDKKTQLAVVVVNDLQGMEASSYAIGLLNAWELGNKGKDNGILMLIKPKTKQDAGKIFIATGYGMEGDLPDIYLSRIINEKIIPSFRAGKNDEGVWLGVEQIVKKIHPDFVYEGKVNVESDEKPSFWAWVIVIVFILWFFSNGFRGLGNVIISSGGSSWGRYGGWSTGRGSSGGFGGFGGRGGGGGAGGSW